VDESQLLRGIAPGECSPGAFEQRRLGVARLEALRRKTPLD